MTDLPATKIAELIELARETIRIAAKGSRHHYSTSAQRQRMHAKLDEVTILALAEEILRRRRVEAALLACYKAAKETALAMGDLSPETAIGESGRDLIRALDDASTRYDIDSLTEREIEANYNAMGRPPAPPGWSSKP